VTSSGRHASGGISESGKKGCGSIAVRHVIEKALPRALPDALVIPSKRVTERTPELRIEEACVHLNGAEAVPSEETSP